MDIIVGTAGHIDHGKTALVKSLTGTDTDRLPEEKRRGITVDLGFAELDLDGTRIGFVDVPGHERFVKNMLAGASGIDLVMFVVAADEGIMPQTREHFDICRLLEIKHGLVAITKSDLVDLEMFELVKAEVREFVAGSFLAGAPIVGVSARSGEGIDELRAALAFTASAVEPRSDRHIVRLPIDRSFAMKGFGSVVTGTLASGTIDEGNELELLPVTRRVRVRGLQTHGRKVSRAKAGRRTAVNLAGVDHHNIIRGMLLTEPGVLHPVQAYNAEVEVLSDSAAPIRSRQRVRMHLGTAEILARVFIVGDQVIHPGETGFVQLRLESPVAAILGERFIIRSYSPQETIAGGSILGPSETRLRRKDAEELSVFLSRLTSELKNDEAAVLRLFTERAGARGATRSEIRSITGWSIDALDTVVRDLETQGVLFECEGVYVSTNALSDLEKRALGTVEKMHAADRLAKAIAIEKIRTEAFSFARPEIEKAVLDLLVRRGDLVIEGDTVRLAGNKAQLSESEKGVLVDLRKEFDIAGLEVPKPDDLIAESARATGVSEAVVRKLLQQLIDSGELTRVNQEMIIASPVVGNLIDKIRSFAESSPDRLIDVPKFKEIAGVSRKYAIPLLEYFDQRKITARRGDKRLVI